MLWKAPVEEGPPTCLGRLPASTAYGATWSPQGEIIVASTNVGRDGEEPALRDRRRRRAVPGSDRGGSSGGRRHVVPTAPAGRRDSPGRGSRRRRPLVDRRPRGGVRSELAHHPGERLAFPVFSAAGYVVYQRKPSTPQWGDSAGIWAFRFDPEKLAREGAPFRVSATGFHPSIARDGTLLYHTIEGESLQQLAWVDRSGKLLETLGEPHVEIDMPEISPDGRRIAYAASVGENFDLWILDLEDGSRSRLTVEPSLDYDPEWSPDGSLIAFASERSGLGDIYVQAASGRGSARPLVATPAPQYYPEWEPDGTGVLIRAYDQRRAGTSGDSRRAASRRCSIGSLAGRAPFRRSRPTVVSWPTRPPRSTRPFSPCISPVSPISRSAGRFRKRGEVHRAGVPRARRSSTSSRERTPWWCRRSRPSPRWSSAAPRRCSRASICPPRWERYRRAAVRRDTRRTARSRRAESPPAEGRRHLGRELAPGVRRGRPTVGLDVPRRRRQRMLRSLRLTAASSSAVNTTRTARSCSEASRLSR